MYLFLLVVNNRDAVNVFGWQAVDLECGDGKIPQVGRVISRSSVIFYIWVGMVLK